MYPPFQILALLAALAPSAQAAPVHPPALPSYLNSPPPPPILEHFPLTPRIAALESRASIRPDIQPPKTQGWSAGQIAVVVVGCVAVACLLPLVGRMSRCFFARGKLAGKAEQRGADVEKGSEKVEREMMGVDERQVEHPAERWDSVELMRPLIAPEMAAGTDRDEPMEVGPFVMHEGEEGGLGVPEKAHLRDAI